jgi:hypothetical protein
LPVTMAIEGALRQAALWTQPGKLEDGVEAATLVLAEARATNEYVSKSHEARLQFLRASTSD